MEADDLREIETLARVGFYDRDRVYQILDEEVYEPGELDPVELAAAVDAAFARLAAEQAGWPDVTDCDRLDAAFAAMGRRGVIALHDAGITPRDGYADFLDAVAREADPARVLGCCFSLGRDLADAVHGRGLGLTFYPADPARQATDGPEVGRIVREELERVGFAVERDDRLPCALRIPAITWQRRPAGG